jgi:S-adenosyl-L-methionine hydrolase (adenosine-forming)
MKTITLTTDFGAKDWFVGTMKGVILGLCPRAAIVDITHEIPPGDVRSAAFALAVSYRYFPRGTVHMVVVDPGVGSSRPALGIRTRNYFFVGPDNGVLSVALEQEEIISIRRLENQSYYLQPVSHTFHGRDVFAPVAARLCGGYPIQRLGPAQSDFVRLRWPKPTTGTNEIRGEIVWLDRFGNLITNIRGELLQGLKLSHLRLMAGGRKGIALATHYQAAPEGELAAVIGSSGLLEIAVNGGSAARKLKLQIGDPVKICRRPARGLCRAMQQPSPSRFPCAQNREGKR